MIDERTIADRVKAIFPDVKYIMRVMRKGSYALVRFMVDGAPYGCPEFPVTEAFTLDGKYIGDPKMARQLTRKFGIEPEYKDPNDIVCTVGFSTRRHKWYGWSHRAIAGFKTRAEAARFAESVS